MGVGSEEGFIREGVWKICLIKYCLITDGNEVMQPATQRSRERTFQAKANSMCKGPEAAIALFKKWQECQLPWDRRWEVSQRPKQQPDHVE